MNIKELKLKITELPVKEQLVIISETYPWKIIFTTSFGLEDQVITHLIFENNLPVEVATIDTGRLFPETYKVYNETFKKYQKRIVVYFPENEPLRKW